MQHTKRVMALFLAGLLTIAVTAVRLMIVPRALDMTTDPWNAGIVLMLVVLALFAVFALLICTGKGEPLPDLLLPGLRATPLAGGTLLGGALLLVTSAWDGVNWLVRGVLPAPTAHSITIVEGVALGLQLLAGIAAGWYLMWLGICLLQGHPQRTPKSMVAALLPTVWIWMRLVRYEVSYASSVRLSRSFYDFALLISVMLFLFALARYVSGYTKPRSRWVLVFALWTVVLCWSGYFTGLGLSMIDREAYAAYTGWMATNVDFGMGAVAAGFALSMLLRPLPVKAEQPVEDTDSNAHVQETQAEKLPDSAPVPSPEEPSAGDLPGGIPQGSE